jgi:SAM-dependent methyltransferase
MAPRAASPEHQMQLKDLQRHWHEFGRRDPLWAILTLPGKRDAGWRVDEFFQTGREEIAQVLAHLDELGLPRPSRRALDFGCGVGRLTQALCEQIGAACGVDIAPSMIERARQFNRHGSRCEYVVNDAEDLSRFADETFDFIFSSRVLQHMRADYSAKYLREFLRVLSPGGAAVFQIPTAPPPAAAGPPTDASIAAAALADAAYRAQITCRTQALNPRPGSVVTISVEVRNVGTQPWPCRRLAATLHPIKLGNHWRTPAGRLLALDDGRTLLRGDLAVGASVELPLVINVPPQPGSYRLELDLVHDYITWFTDKGSAIAQLDVRVRAPFIARCRALAARLRARRGAASRDVTVPVMEMYRVPEESIEALVSSAGGAIVDRVPDCSGGEGWPGFMFYVVKRDPRSVRATSS